MNKSYALQLYSVRDTMETDFEGTLKSVAQMGYTQLEFAGFFGHTADEVNEILKKYNLTVSGTHSRLPELIDNFDEVVAFHKKIGNKNYTIPSADLWTQESIDYFVKNANLLYERLKEHGISLGFHNHAREFCVNPDGSVPFEQLVYRTNIDLQVDTFWAYVGMKDPIALMNRFPDRIKSVHIKDGFDDGKGKPLGMGTAPVDKVFEWAQKNNKLMVVESETLNPSGLAEAKICIDYLHKLEK
ncbi:MAG: sugar phosphate isomerase/epimerase family protein [Acutalibacteraceae bacterium]|jgi:sugar phosphate isomerase/epimerase